jgi:diguanylate cyclase (GGDEF)-like protein/PAS domain S-box-containing protein
MPTHPDTVLSADFLRAVIDSNPDAIAVLDGEGRVLFDNIRYRTLWGNEPPLLDDRESLPGSEQVQHPVTGRWFTRHTYEHMVAGQSVGRVVHWRDVTAVYEAQQSAEYERELMHALMDSVPDQIFFKDKESRFIRINPSLARRYGLQDPAEAIGKSDHDFYTPEHGDKTALDEQRIMQTGEPLVGVVDHEVWPDGTTAWNVSTKMPLYNSQGELIGTYGIAHDITEHKKAEALIWQQANFDALTGLPNRRLVRDRWTQACKSQQREGQSLALLVLDLDHFKEVNDSLGHAMGDLLLVQAGQRISSCVRASDTVARLGGDEFAVILPNMPHAGRAGDIAQSIARALSQPFELDHELAYVSASIGIALWPQDGETLDELFQHADQAMYLTKQRGRNGVSFFTPQLQAASESRLRMVNDLRHAMGLRQLFLVYQPIVELKTGRMHKAEVLLRWRHPEQGLVPPATFIALAESSGLILEIGEWVFQRAAQQLLEWRISLAPALQLAVNKSALQFQSPESSPLQWQAHLESLGLPGNAMVMEITESLLLDNSEAVQRQLRDMAQTGLQVSLDDFGTGYSSLAYLQRYAIDYIKIDQSFVHDLTTNPKNLALCKAIIQMAHALGMKVIGEGIETEEQRSLLLQAGCDYAQGYLFSKPLPAAEFGEYLRAAQTTPLAR